MDELLIRAARLRAVAKFPYLRSALWSIELIESDKFGADTMGADKWWRVYYHPTLDERYNQDEITGMLVHEIHHLILDTAGRAEAIGINQETFQIWNVASDLAINSGLQKEVTLPENGCFPEKMNLPEGEIHEWYYAELMKTAKRMKQHTCGGGSGVDGLEHEHEEPGDSKAKSSVSKSEGELIRRQVAKDVLDHAKKAGTMPGELERWANNLLNPKVDWRTELSGAIKGSIADVMGQVDYTYRKPSRRQAFNRRVIFPTMRGPKPRIGLGIDTSGSMNEDDLAKALAETKGVLDTVQAAVTIYAGDTEVHNKQLVRSVREIKLRGGGGTDMGAVLHAIAEDKPEIAIIISDLYTPWPAEKPRGLTKVIVVGTQAESKAEVPKWAKLILVND